MKNQSAKVFVSCILLVMGAVFSQGPAIYRTVDECRQIGDNGQQNDCTRAVTGRSNAFSVPQPDQATRLGVNPLPIYDTTISYSISGEDTTTTIQIQKRVDISGIQSEIAKLSSATVFIAVMQGLSVLGALITIFVVANK